MIKLQLCSILFSVGIVFTFISTAQSLSPDIKKSWDTLVLDVARHTPGVSPADASVLLEINKARTNPAKYAELYIKPRLQFFDGKRYKKNLITKEGIAAVEDCIKAMSSAKAMPPLSVNEELIELAKYHTEKQSTTRETGHDTPGGRSFNKRFKKYVKKGFIVGENISYGEEDARDIVIQLLIDDGIRNRGHRKNILEPKYTHAGVACGGHLKYSNMCTIDFYGLYKKKKKKKK